jgi:hypothetical protein
MNKRIAAIVASIAVAGSVLLATAGIATAVTSTSGGPAGSGPCVALATAAKGPSATVASVRAFADCEIDRRLTTLTALSSKVASARALLGGHAATLAAEIAGEKSGLVALRGQIATDGTLLALRADLVRIVTEFRVYVLVVPQVNLTLASDATVAAKARFDQIGTALAARIAAAAAAGRDTTAAQAALDAMNASVAAAVALAQPIPGRILPLTPAQFNAGTAGPAITAARTALVGARDDLKAAAASAKACLQALK